MHKLAVVTVVYNNYDILDDFIKSFKEQTSKEFQIYIVDVSDKSEPIPSHGLPITVIQRENKGYASGINAGIKIAVKDGMKLFAVINSDTYVHQDFVHSAIAASNKYKNSVIGGKIYYAKGYEYHLDTYSNSELGNVLWYAGGYVDWNHVIAHHIGVDEVDNKKYDTSCETEFITGCLMIVPLSVIEEVGYMDESYFLYYEDADWCERIKAMGFKLIYHPKIILWHKNAQSTGGSGSKIHDSYQKSSRLKFGLKYAPLRTKLHLLKNYLISLHKKRNGI